MNLIRVIIARRYEVHQTPGSLYVFDHDRAVANVKTLELPWLNNIRRESCIPPGTYECERFDHPRMGQCWLLDKVPDRSEIMIHSGNFASGKKVDIEGCIMPGLRFIDINLDGNLDVADSVKAMNILRAILPDKFKLTIL